MLIIQKLWILKQSEEQEIYLGCHIQGVTHEISQNHSTSAARLKRNLLLLNSQVQEQSDTSDLTPIPCHNDAIYDACHKNAIT